MSVIVRRANDYTKKAVDLEDITDSKWSRSYTVGNSTRYFPYSIIIAKIPYVLAYNLDLASGSHIDNNNGANIRIYATDNKQAPYKNDYAKLCNSLGGRPQQKKSDLPDRIREVVQQNPGILATEVADILSKQGYYREDVLSAICRLRKTKTSTKINIRGVKSRSTYKLYIE